MNGRNEVHACNANNGHMNSSDCWCEPSEIQWVTNKHQIKVLVVTHCDLTLEHRQTVLANREIDRRYGLGKGVDELWITLLLDPFGDPPLMLPPFTGAI